MQFFQDFKMKKLKRTAFIYIKSFVKFFNQITFIVTAHVLVSEILESVRQKVQKQFTYRQYILTDLSRRQCAEYTNILSTHGVLLDLLIVISTHYTLCTHIYT